MQYWIFPLIGFVGLTWNKNSNLFEIIDCHQLALLSSVLRIGAAEANASEPTHSALVLRIGAAEANASAPSEETNAKLLLLSHAERSKEAKKQKSNKKNINNNILINKKNENYNLNQISKSVESSFSFPIQQEQESYPNDLYEYYFMAKSELEQKLSKLNNNGNQLAFLSSVLRFGAAEANASTAFRKTRSTSEEAKKQKSVKSFIKNYQVYDKDDMLLNFFLWSKTRPIEIGTLFFNKNKQNLTNIVPTLTSNIREIYKNSPKKLLPISMYYKNLNNNNLRSRFAEASAPLKQMQSFCSTPSLLASRRRSRPASKRAERKSKSQKEEKHKSKTQRNKIKKNTLFSLLRSRKVKAKEDNERLMKIIKIPNTFSIKPINQKQKDILHDHPIRSYEKAKILLDNAIKNFLLKETNNKDKNFKNFISIYSLDKLKNQNYFINKNITQSKLLFNFSILKSSQKNKCLSDSKINSTSFGIFEFKNKEPEQSKIANESNILKVQNNNKVKENNIFIKKVTEKLKFDLDKLLFSKRFKKNFILLNNNTQQNHLQTKFASNLRFFRLRVGFAFAKRAAKERMQSFCSTPWSKRRKNNLKFLFLLNSNLKNTKNILKNFKKMKGRIPSIKENKIKNYIYELSVLNYWKKSLNLLNLNNNKLSYSSKFFKKDRFFVENYLNSQINSKMLQQNIKTKEKILANFVSKQPAQPLCGSIGSFTREEAHAELLLLRRSRPASKAKSTQKKNEDFLYKKNKVHLKKQKHNERNSQEFFNKFVKIQKLLKTNTKNSSLFPFQSSNFNPIKLNNSIITSDLFYKDNFNILSNKFLYNKKQNLLYNYHLYSSKINSKENYINRNFYKKNKKVLGKFILKSIANSATKINDFNKFPVKFKNQKFETSSFKIKDHSELASFASVLRIGAAEANASEPKRRSEKHSLLILSHRSFADAKSEEVKSKQKSKIQESQSKIDAEQSKILQTKEKNSINFILHLKQISFNINNFNSKLYSLIDNIYNIFSNDLTKKTTSLETNSKNIKFVKNHTCKQSLQATFTSSHRCACIRFGCAEAKNRSEKPLLRFGAAETKGSSHGVSKAFSSFTSSRAKEPMRRSEKAKEVRKKLIKKKNNLKVFKLGLNTKSFNKNLKKNKKEKIFRSLLSYKFSYENANPQKEQKVNLKKNIMYSEMKLQNNLRSSSLLDLRQLALLSLAGRLRLREASSEETNAKLLLHSFAARFAKAKPTRKRTGGAKKQKSKIDKAKQRSEVKKKLKKRMRNLLSINSNNNKIHYKFDYQLALRSSSAKPSEEAKKQKSKIDDKKTTFKKINSLNSSALFSQSVIGNKIRVQKLANNISFASVLRSHSAEANASVPMRMQKKEKNYYKNKISLNRILRRIGFVFLSELKIKKNSYQNINVSLYNMNLNKKDLLIQRFEKEKSLQKKRRRKKLKLETRRRKKRKRFYPRPIWLRYSLYKKFLNSRHSYNNFYYRKKVFFASLLSLAGRQSLRSFRSTPSLLRLCRPASERAKRSEEQNLQSTMLSFAERMQSKENNKKLSIHIPEKNEKIINISNFFLKNQKLKNKIYRNNKQKWGNFIQDTPQFEKISLKKIKFFPHFPVFQNKEYYKVSSRILAEFQPLCWKSYWLRSNLTPYMNRIQKNFSFMKQVEKTNNISNINTFLYKIFGFFSYDFYSFKFKMLPFYTDFKNSFDNQHAFYLSNLLFQESTNKIAEYNRIEFERFSEILKNVKFNMNLEGQLKPKSYKFIAWKYLLSSRELKTFNKKNFWYRLSYNTKPNLSSVSPFVILSNTFSKNSASIKPYGSSGTLRALWTFNKSNIFTFKEKNQIRDLWEQTKLREQLKSNQTKKFLMNLIKVKDNLYLKDIFSHSLISHPLLSESYNKKNLLSFTDSFAPKESKVPQSESNFQQMKEEVTCASKAFTQAKDTKKSSNLKNLNIINFSTIKKLQTTQRKLVLMSLFQQNSLVLMKQPALLSLAGRLRLREASSEGTNAELLLHSVEQKKKQNYSNSIQNKMNNICFNYYIRLLKSKISNSKLNTKKNLTLDSIIRRAMQTQRRKALKSKNFVFSYTLKNKKDLPFINIGKPRLLKPSSYFWWSSKNFQIPFNLNIFNDSYTSLFFFHSFTPLNAEHSEKKPESYNKKEKPKIQITQQTQTNKLIVFFGFAFAPRAQYIFIFSILLHLSILFSFIRIPELRGLLKFQILLFYKISNSYFIILYSIYDLLKKYKTETFKTYNSLYQKTYKLLSYINILDLESQNAHSFRSFGKSDYSGLHFEKETNKIVFSELASFASSRAKEPMRRSASSRAGRLRLREASSKKSSEEAKKLKLKNQNIQKTKTKEKRNFYNLKYSNILNKINKNNKQKKQFSSYYFLYKISFYKNLKNKKYFYFPTLNQMSDLTLKSMHFYDKPYDFSYSIKQWAGALKYPKIYNKNLKSYNENKKLVNKVYFTSKTPFIYSFSYNFIEFFYSKKILSTSSNNESNKKTKKNLYQKSDFKILKLDIKKNFITELYKRFMSFKNIQTYFALFFLYLSYGFVRFSIGLFESSYQFLLKIIDLFESFLLIIYKFLEKPAELMIEWIAQIFLIEWSSDPSSFIPETFDMYFWYSFQKFFRNTRILGFVEFQNSTNIYNIMNSFEFSGFNGKQIQFHNYNNDILSIEKTLGTSMFSFSISNILGFFMQRRLWNFFHLFIDSMLKPDIDLIIRQKKGKIFWDIWADILIRAAEQYNINIPSLTSLKEEQEKLIEQLIQDPAFINFSVLNSLNNNNVSSPVSNNLQSIIMTKTYNFKNKSKISNISYNRNVLKNFYKTKSWSSNQYVTFNLKDTDLFLDISPPKSLLYVHFINGYEPIQYTLGSIMCEIYSGLFSNKVSKNLLIVNSHVSDLPLRSAISSNFLQSNKSSFDFQSRGSYGSLIIQALAGESEMKMMIDNANRYASLHRGVAVGMKLLRDVFESIVLQTPCFFLMEDLHVIGERRPMLISDDENSYEKEFSIFGFEQDEESEKNQMIYQSSRHSINDFRRPYKGDFSMLIPTNLYNKDLYSFKTFLNNTKPTRQKKYPISLSSIHDTIENKMFDQSYDKNKSLNASQSFNISRLQIVSENFFAPPATSPFTILMMKEQRKLKPKKVVKQISWNSFVAENIIASKNDSIRVKVAILADMTLRNFSYNKDMITDLLVIIDGVRSNRGFVVFATTHVPSILDPALRRPGRFDETISLPLLPNLMNRWSLFQMHFNQEILQKKVSKETFDRFEYGILTENFNFSQISNLISKTKLSCNVNYNRVKSPIIHPSQALQSFFIEKDFKMLPSNFCLSKSFAFVSRSASSSNKNLKKIYSQISFGYFQIGNLLISSDFLKDQTYFSLNNKSLLLEQSSPFVYNTLYSSLNTFKMFIMRLLGGKIAEFLLTKNQRNLYDSSNKTNKNQLTYASKAFASFAARGAKAKPTRMQSSEKAKVSDKFNLYYSSFTRGANQSFMGSKIPNKAQKLNFSIMDHMIRYKSWHFATSLIFSILQKRFLYNKNLIITKMLSFDNPNQSSLREPPSPPASSLLMPSKKYENFKRIERDFQQKSVFSIYEKMQMHQKQRFLKRLYNKPVLESFKSQLFENRFTSFESSFKEFSYNKDSNLLKLSSSHSYYKNRLNVRHRFSLINQWWNGQLAEHNVEVTYLSDIDWRTMYIQSYSESYNKNTKENHKNLLSDISSNNQPSYEKHQPSYEKLGLKQSKSILSYSKTSNKTDSMLDFPDADQHYNPRVRRWFLNANSWNYWLNFENTFYYEIYHHMIYDAFNKTSLYFNQNRELLDFFVYTYNIKGSLKEIDLIFILSRFYRK
uniref:Cell division protein n=1 Tax=Pseudopediastrum integrum TaxID=271402 RepID=A0A2U8GJF5_9CHLO|nr:cell division protein [Pseudopediastrum integrum]AWI68769.1 cell division protein [Pseudopediastrum integrum]